MSGGLSLLSFSTLFLFSFSTLFLFSFSTLRSGVLGEPCLAGNSSFRPILSHVLEMFWETLGGEKPGSNWPLNGFVALLACYEENIFLSV